MLKVDCRGKAVYSKVLYLYSIRLALLFLLIPPLASACMAQPSTPLPPEPTDTPTPLTATPTRTPVWFPPTATFTPPPIPVMTPTLDQRPQIGDQILADDFTETNGWSVAQTATTSAAFGKGELFLALNQPKAEISSLRQKTDLT